MTQLQLPIVETGVSERLAAILQRYNDKVKLGSSLFDERGERDARAIAATAAAPGSTLPERSARQHCPAARDQ